jgi:phosphodiesterase/alkaline phosphatase D-like protein
MRIAMLLIAFVLCPLAIAQSTSNAPSKSATAAPSQTTIINGPVAEHVTDSKATIGWETASSAALTLRYGTDRDHLNQTATAEPSTDGRRHHATLEGLTSETPYYFQVMDHGVEVGRVGTFTTVAAGAAPLKSRATIPR